MLDRTKWKRVVFDPENSLDRIEDETTKANLALYEFAALGAQRSMRKLLEVFEKRTNAPTYSIKTIELWSARFGWQDRIAAWEKVRCKRKEDEWLKRRHEQEETEWLVSTKLFALVSTMLAEAPKFLKTRRRVVKETGQEIITMELDSRFMVAAAEAASKLGRLAAGMDTERQHLEHSGVLPVVDVSGMDDEQLRNALLKLGNIAALLASAQPGADLPGSGQDDDPHDPAGEVPVPANA
jgi:hypothetical protein